MHAVYVIGVIISFIGFTFENNESLVFTYRELVNFPCNLRTRIYYLTRLYKLLASLISEICYICVQKMRCIYSNVAR